MSALSVVLLVLVALLVVAALVLGAFVIARPMLQRFRDSQNRE